MRKVHQLLEVFTKETGLTASLKSLAVRWNAIKRYRDNINTLLLVTGPSPLTS